MFGLGKFWNMYSGQDPHAMVIGAVLSGKQNLSERRKVTAKKKDAIYVVLNRMTVIFLPFAKTKLFATNMPNQNT